jgi:hypothetical protein
MVERGGEEESEEATRGRWWRGEVKKVERR